MIYWHHKDFVTMSLHIHEVYTVLPTPLLISESLQPGTSYAMQKTLNLNYCFKKMTETWEYDRLEP